MADAHNDDESRSAEAAGVRRDRPQGTHEPSAADHVWVAVLVVIIVVLVLVGILSHIDMNDSGSPTQDWNTVWH
ncbi:hypothetical protein ACFU8I_00270 [Streptomyces sp. NPDC057540]|uniref:hypothetical protein n=1 Tax=Streptomyces sp. NPDC057540 TaxID=3346160 RepID=UPI0036B056E1